MGGWITPTQTSAKRWRWACSRQYAPDFFDLIIVDKGHRGGANDEGKWRGIPKYFLPAGQLGLTATPTRRNNVDTYPVPALSCAALK